MSFDYKGRLERLRSAMDDRDVGSVLLSVGADLPYFTGYEVSDSERLTMLVVTQDESVLVVPALEAPGVGSGAFEIRSWTETEDPVDIIASLVSDHSTTAIGDHTRSKFLLEFLKKIKGEWIPASELTSRLRSTKDKAEVGALRQVAREADLVAGRIPTEIRFVGATESAVSHQVQEMLLDEGHDVAEFGIIASGPNGASPHHSASDRVIREGDLVVMDFGGRKSGYWSDTTRTFIVGEPSKRQAEIHSVVREAQRRGRDTVRPGVRCEQVDAVVRDVIDSAGYGEFFIHRTGHGIGLEVHESPFLVTGSEEVLNEGMTFSIEPGIYVPGELGVRIEDIVVCTEDGIESLNSSRRDLISVE